MTIKWTPFLSLLIFLLLGMIFLPIFQEDIQISLSTYQNVINQGIVVLGENIPSFAIISSLIFICASASILFLGIFNAKFKNSFSNNNQNILDLISLGLSGSSIFLFIVSFPGVMLGELSIILFLLFIFALILYSGKIFKFIEQVKNKKFPPNIFKGIVPFLGTFLLLLFLKSSYIYELELPLNIDSVNHTYLIDQIISGNRLETLPYYHYGFHYIIIYVSHLTGENIPKTMLIFGQILQLIIPVTIYFPVHKITNNSKAAIFCVFVAGLGFNMPTISTSWGKYPALLVLLSFWYVLLVCMDVFEQPKVSPTQYISATVVILISVLIHTRMLIILMSVFLAFFIDRRVKFDEKLKGIVMGSILMAILTSMFYENNSRKALGLVMQPYTETSILFGLLIFSMPFSAFYFGRYTSRIGLVITLLVILFFTPTPKFLNDQYNATTMIDRPFLSMFLFIPICTLLGLGLAGILKFIQNYVSQIKTTVLIGLLFVVFLFPNQKILKPLPSSIMAGKDDYLLYEDIKNHLPEDAKIGVPNSPGSYYDLGVDGGIWVAYKTKHPVYTVRYDSDLSSCSVISQICATGTEYLYSGNKPYSFSVSEQDISNSLYQLTFNYPKAKLYRIMGCFICKH